MITQPYVGLRPFKQHEHEIFFGREECVTELVELLGKTNFIAIVSEAYCGKTSLVHCGLETKLLEDTETQWHIANFQPHFNPFVQLGTSLLKYDVLGEYLSFNHKDATESLKQVLAYGHLSLHQLLEQNNFPKDHKLLLVCDQFEDIFNLYEQNKSLAEKFVQLLVSSAKKHPKKIKIPYDIYVIVTLRSNYLDKVSYFPYLDQIIRNNIYLVPHLNKAQLKEAIIKPALFIESQKNKIDEDDNFSTEDDLTGQKDYFKNNEDIDGFYKEIERNELFSDDSKNNNEKESDEAKQSIEKIEDKLVEFLLKNITGSGDKLPLLQHLLMRMWELSLTELDHSLTIEMYKKNRVGGFSEALPRHLEETYYSLKENQQVIAKNLFCQLVEVKTNKESFLLPIPVKIAEVARLEQTSVEEIIKVIEEFRRPERAFLIPAYPANLDAETFVEISHESILLHWSQLTDWKAEERRAERNYRTLDEFAHQYFQKKGSLLKENQKQKNELWQWSESENAVTQTWAGYYGCNYDLIERYLLKSKNLFAYFHKYYSLGMYGSLCFMSILMIWSLLPPYKEEFSVPSEKTAREILYQTEKDLILKKEAFYLEKKCNEATIDQPDSADSWFHCGFWMAYQGKLDEAETAYVKSRELDPDNTDTLLQLAKIWVIKRRFDEAEPVLNGLLAKDSKNEEILYQLGEILTHEDSLKKSRNRQLGSGVHYYKAALALFPENDKTLNHLGRTFSLLGDHVQALENLKKAVKINPQNADAWYNLGNTYIKNAQIKEGLETIRKLIEINPRNSKYWRILGHLHMKNAQSEEAAKAFTKALGLNPQNDENLRNLGLALLKKGDLVAATEAFANAVILNKNNDTNHRNLGDVWLKRNKLDKALKFYSAAQKIKASKINLIKKADVLTKLNQYKKASHLYKQAAVMKESDWE